MRFSRLGKTTLDVSAVVLGGAAIGEQYGPVSVAEVRETVFAALDAGVNMVDTSAYYGLGRSEEVLGEVLDGVRHRMMICTKAGRKTRSEFDFSPAGMTASLDASLKRLRTDHVEVLAHDIEFATDFEQLFTETIETLHRLKATGKCRYIGVSCLPLGLLKHVIEQCEVDVVISYCHHTLQSDRLLTDLLPTAHAHGVGVMNASPLAMGLLTNQGPPPWNPAPKAIRTACRLAAEHCRSRGADIATLGMQHCFQEPRMPFTITGTAKRDELLANLTHLDTAPDEQLRCEVQAILAPIHGQTWPLGHWRDSAVPS
jgi:L-galactose dehydrogenase